MLFKRSNCILFSDCGLSSSRVASASPYKYFINRVANRLFESGIRTKHLQWAVQYVKSANRKVKGNNECGNKFRPLTLSRNYGMFVLYIGGIVFGCSVFILEILWKWLTTAKPKKLRRHYKKEIGFDKK